MHKHAAGAYARGIFDNNASTSGIFSSRNAAHGAGLHISSKHSRFFQLMGQQFVSSILFLQLTEGVDAYVLWCETSTALKDNIFRYAGFSLGLWAALWANDWADGQGDSWALRMPYAYLTQITNHALGKLRQYLSKRCI